MKVEAEKLLELYNKKSKHSSYQQLPEVLNSFFFRNITQSISRYEKERMKWVKEKISLQGKSVLDIGGNTGYFSFEAISAGANDVTYIEGNKEHAEFVGMSADLLRYDITVINEYLDFVAYPLKKNHDIVFLFNVIHHFGDDFGQQDSSISEAKNRMSNAINFFADKCSELVLQMGFCWKGDRDKPLFQNGTKKEMIGFVTDAAYPNWKINHIGIAEGGNYTTCYKDLSPENIHRNDALGEFRNRPIFILKSEI